MLNCKYIAITLYRMEDYYGKTIVFGYACAHC